jgi:hypothetical protein
MPEEKKTVEEEMDEIVFKGLTGGSEPAFPGGGTGAGPVEVDVAPTVNAANAFLALKRSCSGTELDLVILKEANAIRRNSERFKAVRALPGGSGL